MIEKIQLWIEKSVLLKKLKKEERALRNELSDFFSFKENRQKYPNYDIKNNVSKINNIDNAVLSNIWPDLNESEKACFEFLPKLIKKQYDKLPKNSLVHSAIISKSGAPSLKIEEKK